MSGWDTLAAAIATARAELMAIAPDPATATEGEAYLARVVTSSLADAFLGHHFVKDGLATPLATKGGPNPDFLMSHAVIDPARRYRLEGNLNDSERVGVGFYYPGPGGAMRRAAYAAFDRGTVDAQGCFSLDLAAGATGPGTLALTPDCRIMLIRVLHRPPAKHPCTIAFSSGAVAPSLSLATGNWEGAMGHVAQSMLRGVRHFIAWSQSTAASPNIFTEPPPSIAESVRGDPDITYYLGYYDLRDGEWLETTIPVGLTGYWSVHAYNHWLELLPGPGAHDLNAVPDPDGRVRVRIGPMLPSVLPNWVDTLGRHRGVLIFRSIGDADVPTPESHVRRG